ETPRRAGAWALRTILFHRRGAEDAEESNSKLFFVLCRPCASAVNAKHSTQNTATAVTSAAAKIHRIATTMLSPRRLVRLPAGGPVPPPQKRKIPYFAVPCRRGSGHNHHRSDTSISFVGRTY